jgi:hypothetical protein
MELQLDNIKERLKLLYLTNLKISSNKLLIDLTHLNNEILELSNNCNITENIGSNISETIILTDTDILSENIDYLFLKPWNKLNQIHKVIKIKEFVKNLDCPFKDRENLKDQIIELLKNKNKVKFSYNESKGQLISISALSFKDGKYYIEK